MQHPTDPKVPPEELQRQNEEHLKRIRERQKK